MGLPSGDCFQIIPSICRSLVTYHRQYSRGGHTQILLPATYTMTWGDPLLGKKGRTDLGVTITRQRERHRERQRDCPGENGGYQSRTCSLEQEGKQNWMKSLRGQKRWSSGHLPILSPTRFPDVFLPWSLEMSLLPHRKVSFPVSVRSNVIFFASSQETLLPLYLTEMDHFFSNAKENECFPQTSERRMARLSHMGRGRAERGALETLA